MLSMRLGETLKMSAEKIIKTHTHTHGGGKGGRICGIKLLTGKDKVCPYIRDKNAMKKSCEIG